MDLLIVDKGRDPKNVADVIKVSPLSQSMNVSGVDTLLLASSRQMFYGLLDQKICL